MAFPPRQRIEPGYCVVETPGTLSSQGNILFRNPRSEAARYFMQLRYALGETRTYPDRYLTGGAAGNAIGEFGGDFIYKIVGG
ncbi:hypothetical protein ACWA06_09150 [Serratia rhizosphaerae]|nr:hypothetical protein [Serratia rubidaea]